MRRGGSAAVTFLGCAMLAACGPGGEGASVPAPPPPAATVGCSEGGSNPNALAPGWQSTSVVSGPLTLAYIDQYASQHPSAFAPVRKQLRRVLTGSGSSAERDVARRTLKHTPLGSYAAQEALLRVAAGRQVTVMVDPDQRSSVALIYSRHARNQERPGAQGAYRVADGDRGVTFRACPTADTDFLGGIVVAGAQCAELTVTSPGRRPAHLRVPFGDGTCAPATRIAAHGQRFLARAPYLGVACPRAKSIACDRVGLAVWLRRAAVQVTATVNGEPLRLREGGFGGRGPLHWEGYRQPAGMLDGTLKVTPGQYFWQASHPKDAHVVISIHRADGTIDETALTVPLSAGWG